jgi:hypothetical protein
MVVGKPDILLDAIQSSLTRADLASDQKDVEWIAAMVDDWSNSAGTRGAEIRL